MDKALQDNINRWVMDNYNDAMEELRNDRTHTCERLRTCTAWVYETDNYYLLRSYNTFVCVIRKDIKQAYDALRRVYGYTSTSAQHIAKFCSDYGDRCLVYTYR